jgi:hypothetical protein
MLTSRHCLAMSHPVTPVTPPHDDNDEDGDNDNDTTSQDNNNDNDDATSQDNNNNNNNNISSGWRGGRIWTGSGPKRASFGPGTFFFSFIRRFY